MIAMIYDNEATILLPAAIAVLARHIVDLRCVDVSVYARCHRRDAKESLSFYGRAGMVIKMAFLVVVVNHLELLCLLLASDFQLFKLRLL